jgi:endonuclease I
MAALSRRFGFLFLLLASLFLVSCSDDSTTTDPGGDPPPPSGNIPEGYYDTVDDSTPASLRTTLHPVIDDHKRIPYTSSATDTWNVLEQADQDPNDSGRILDVYRNASYPKYGAGNNDYNREHVWPKSYGFPDDGSTNYPYTDCHHLFLCDSGYNSSRGNKPYGSVGASGSEKTTIANDGVGGGSGTYPGWSNWYSATYWETWRDRRGDVARALFYLDIRYEGGQHGSTGYSEPDLILTDNPALIQVTGSNASVAYMGLISVLLDWHYGDPVDEKEVDRNDAVYDYQGNRNPFIDHPEWVDCLFDEDCGN